ncbi:triphosphoribosyl-dephospho-CoA synthase [Methylovirgula ligni]|uniref:Triphosphoribosyl-dephospho-CoA synthase n=1 Tax=Methylovirgula ligni TaxID=569860 RepID=A0A3D9Z2J9_9HYPH|nr:triphosphoribosyl-dephospho-CoA synthase [Methylovirgula ligni]REF89337.1 triphosphoribosyl-dephospho-CoA synthase [Methylovirgula ligni]
MIFAAAIAEAFRAACREEIEAPKPGNVHVFAGGHNMEAAHFLTSAEASAGPLAAPGASVGARVLGAVTASFDAVGMNTNLGIVLLCAPLAAAAERGGPLRPALAHVLAGLDRNDADQVFRAIALANPGGLGAAAHHDVRHPADTSLLEAMREAAPRDRIAYQYASDFDDIFVTGLFALAEAQTRGLTSPLRAVAVYLVFLSSFADTHVFRKFGAGTAAEVRREATEMLLLFHSRRGDCLPELLAFDQSLKARGLNPGTSADLTVATLFADRLRNGLPSRRNDD